MKTKLYEGKHDYKVIIFAAWGLGKSPGGLSGGTASNDFGFLMFLIQLNGLQWC